jgi:hypothetical protein
MSELPMRATRRFKFRVAVFLGGTSGIDPTMAELFTKQTKERANIVLIERNKAAAEKIIIVTGLPT